jgi:hypothetical protein
MSDDRLRDLSETIEQLTESMRNLESRVFALENGQPAEIFGSSPEVPPENEAEIPGEEFGFTRPSATRVFFLLGRAILILAGAAVFSISPPWLSSSCSSVAARSLKDPGWPGPGSFWVWSQPCWVENSTG